MTRRSCAVALAALLGRNFIRAGQQGPAGGSSESVAPPRPPSETPPRPAPASSTPASASDAKSAIRVNVDLVNVLFSVRRKKNGELVASLTQNDFQVFEDGKEQPIARFSRDADQPLNLGLLIDVSRSQTRLMGNERDAAAKFITAVMRPKDQAFLLSFGHDTMLEQDFTESAPEMEAALKRVKADAPEEREGGRGGSRGGGGGGVTWPGSGGGRFPGGGGRFPGGGGGGGGRRGGGPGQDGHHAGTKLYDAVYLASNEELAHKTGRKALLLITDGNDRGSYYTREQAIESAQRADAIVYGIYYVDESIGRFERQRDAGDVGLDTLKRMSGETGGRAFTIDKKQTLQQAFADIQEEMRSQYAIAWKPTLSDAAHSYREIEIRPKDAGLAVQSRKGYYASTGQGS